MWERSVGAGSDISGGAVLAGGGGESVVGGAGGGVGSEVGLFGQGGVGGGVKGGEVGVGNGEVPMVEVFGSRVVLIDCGV